MMIFVRFLGLDHLELAFLGQALLLSVGAHVTKMGLPQYFQ